MNKNDIITKLQDMAASAREELNRNDGSTLQTISSAILGSYENVRASIAESARTQKALTAAKRYLSEAGKAIKNGDRKLSVKTLDALDKFLNEHKDQEAAEKKKAAPPKKPAQKPAGAAVKKTAAVKSGEAKKAAGRPAAGKTAAKPSAKSKAAEPD